MVKALKKLPLWAKVGIGVASFLIIIFNGLFIIAMYDEVSWHHPEDSFAVNFIIAICDVVYLQYHSFVEIVHFICKQVTDLF
jgi:hypothetical protein